MRKLSIKFMADLVNSDGVLHPILTRVKKDHTLMLAIRDICRSWSASTFSLEKNEDGR